MQRTRTAPNALAFTPLALQNVHISPHQLSHKHSVLPQSHAKGSQQKAPRHQNTTHVVHYKNHQCSVLTLPRELIRSDKKTLLKGKGRQDPRAD